MSNTDLQREYHKLMEHRISTLVWQGNYDISFNTITDYNLAALNYLAPI